MIRVERNLERLDLTDSLEFLLEVDVFKILWNLSNENIVGHELLFVASEKLLIELKSSAWLVSNLEVFHGLNSLVESGDILNVNDSGVERSDEIFSDLWLGVKDNSSLLLESNGDFL